MSDQEQQQESFAENNDGYDIPDSGPDSNLLSFLAANKIDLNKLNEKKEGSLTSEEQRQLAII